MAQLFTLLDHHARHQPKGALQKSMGDGYLITHNLIYQRMREFVILQNIEFTTAVTPEIIALPLGQLEQFLKNKKIYYCDNVSILKIVEASCPLQISWQSMNTHLKRNMIFHESCHFLARHHFDKTLGTSTQRSVLQIILEESFANTCELLAIKDVHDNVHKSFYEFNSYMFHLEQKDMIKELINELGLDKVFLWTMLNYVFSNYLYKALADRDLLKIASFVGLPSNISPQLFKHLKYISRLALQLSPDFKNATTTFYLKYHGYSDELERLKNFDVMAQINKNPEFKVALTALVNSLL